MRTTWIVTLVLAAVGGAQVVGCSSEPQAAQRQQAESALCPTGQVMFTFGVSSPGENSAEYDSQRAPGTTPYRMNLADEIFTAACTFDGGSNNGDGGTPPAWASKNYLARARERCANTARCWVPWTDCIDPTALARNPKLVDEISKAELTYHCSLYAADRVESERAVPQFYQGGWQGTPYGPWPYCPQVRGAVVTNPRKVCVPEQCHGATRRDQDMNCAQDFNRPIVKEEDLQVAPLGLSPLFQARVTEEGSDGTVDGVTRLPLPKRGLYPYDLHSIDGGLVTTVAPPQARAVLWVTDTWVHPTEKTTVEVYRCQALSFEAGEQALRLQPDGGSPLIRGQIVLSPECFNADVQAAQVKLVAERLGTTAQQFMGDHVRQGSRFHVSYDLEEKTIFLPKGVTKETACGVNPLNFFFVPSAHTYDYQAWLAQREIHAVVDAPSLAGYSFEGAPNRIELGVSDFRVRTPEITVRLNSPRPSAVAVDFDYYLANDREFAFGNLGYRHIVRPKVTAYLVPRAADGGFMPASEDGFEALGAPVELTGADSAGGWVGPNGGTVNATYVPSAALKAKLGGTDTAFAVGADDARTYEVVACLSGDTFSEVGGSQYGDGEWTIRPGKWAAPFWASPQAYKQITEFVQARFQVNYAQKYYAALGNEAAGREAWRPPGFPSAGVACRWSKMPLIIHVDRSVPSVQGFATTMWDGQPNNQKNGNGSMTQSLDNDSDRTCDTNASGKQKCTSSTAAGQQGEGEMGRGYFSVNTDSNVDPGSGDSSHDNSSASGDGELLGFTVLDPMSADDTKQWDSTDPTKAHKLTITITPPWDKIWEAIKLSSQGTLNPEWEKGRYAGVMGLGVGWGFKIPLNQFGMVTITIAVGFSLALTFSIEYPVAADGQYPCLNPANGKACVAVNQKTASLEAAQTQCAAAGARLAELGNADESAAVFNAISAEATNTFWVGGQIANEFSPSACRDAWSAATCTPNHKSHYRWLSNDDEFGTSTGSGAGAVSATLISTTNWSSISLMPRVPSRGGVTVNQAGEVRTKDQSSTLPSVCLYDPATSDLGLKITTEVDLGVAAGIGVEWCWPNDEVGLCLAGNLNLVSFGIKPSLTYSLHLLKDAQNRKSRRENLNVNVKWHVTLLEGSVEAKVKAFIFEFSYTLYEFGGFIADEGTLYDYNHPTVEAFR